MSEKKLFVFPKNETEGECSAYDHQKKISNILNEMDKADDFSTIITVPTGGGKTKIGIDFCLEKLLDTKNDNRVVWMADSVDLLIQSMERFRDSDVQKDISYQLLCGTSVYSNMSRSKSEGEKVDKINSSVEELCENAKIVFASVETLTQEKAYNSFKDWLITAQKKGKVYLIYDEVHHIGASNADAFFSRLFGKEKGCARVLKRFGLIGLTATVYRYDSPVESFNKWFKNGYQDGECIRIDNDYGNGEGSFKNNRIDIVSIQELIEKKILMKPDIIRVDDFSRGTPKNDSVGMNYLAEKIKINYKEWNKTIIFVDGVENAFKLKELLGTLVPCFVYTSDIPDKVLSPKCAGEDEKRTLRNRFFEERSKDLEVFKKTDGSQSKIMIAVDMVSEGFDVKDIQTIYLYSKVFSHISIRQKVGRVLRVADEEIKSKATVYWQNYFEDRREVKQNLDNKDLTYDKDVEESTEEIQRDIRSWKKGRQLPAGMYLEPLPIDAQQEKEIYKRYEFLHALDMFGLDFMIEGVGYYNLEEGETAKVYAREVEKKGYEAFFRVIRSDYYSLLFEKKNYSEFENYATALGAEEAELLDNIKVNCFFMSDASIKDTKGKVTKKKYIVKDNEIKAFYKYVMKHDLSMPEYIPVSRDDKEEDSEENIDNSDTSSKQRDVNIGAKLEEYMKNSGITGEESLLEGMKLHQKYMRYETHKRWKNNKRYADILTYGKAKVTYYEMLSARTLMNVGAVAEPREQGTIGGITGNLALIAKNEQGKYQEHHVLARATKDLTDDDLLLAQALITVPNRICVAQEDVDEYRNLLIAALTPKNIKISHEKKVAREFMMALGYADNDGIIRIQCELFSQKLPRILQYIIYCKAYYKLADEVEFFDENDIPNPFCLNEKVLKDSYQALLEKYQIDESKLESLEPVQDVISDYRPYLKAMPYYQGIKPEFLCRTLNEMLRLGNKRGKKFCDAFGGSGTVSMNIETSMQKKGSIYNDLGIFNHAFFTEICEDKGKALKDKVDEFIKLIIKEPHDDAEIESFLQPYVDMLDNKCRNIEEQKNKLEAEVVENDKNLSEEEKKEFAKKREKVHQLEKKLNVTGKKRDYLTKGYNEIEKEYIEKRDKVTVSHNENKEKKYTWIEIEKRISERDKYYLEILSKTMTSTSIPSKESIRELEKFLHAFLLKIYYVFENLVMDEYELLCGDADKSDLSKYRLDLAFVFFVCNCLSRRHIYNDATIDKLAGFIGTYQVNIDNAAKIFKNVKIQGRDALKLMEEEKLRADEDMVWYCDIPYSETDVSTYSSDWFDEKKFVEALSECKGDYVVASRFNICGIKAKEAPDENIFMTNKEKNIIKFFNRFVSSETAELYEDDVKTHSPYEENEEDGYEGENPNLWNHISEGREAKYVVFLYTNTELKTDSSGSKADNKKYEKNHITVSKDSIRRMLKNTQLSDIAVEIMITNMQLDDKKMPVKKIDNDGKIWCIPSFTTQSSYKIEPVVIIMDYKMFMEEMVLYLVTQDIFELSSHTAIAAFFDKYYKNGLGLFDKREGDTSSGSL
jgi:superfamily II DNA or RNA helicase